MGRRHLRSHVTEVVQGRLWRRVALTEVDTRVGVVSTWLLDTSGCSSIGVFIHGRLHLLQELVNIHQVVLGSNVRERQCILVLRNGATAVASVMAINRNHLWASMHVVKSTDAC